MTRRTQWVITLMKSDLGRSSSLSHIARSVNLSSSRLRHVFKAETGITPTQYLQMLRMELAKQLLETTVLTVKEIAFMTGIACDSYLVREFKKTYGVSPARYREYYQRNLRMTESAIEVIAKSTNE